MYEWNARHSISAMRVKMYKSPVLCVGRTKALLFQLLQNGMQAHVLHVQACDGCQCFVMDKMMLCTVVPF